MQISLLMLSMDVSVNSLFQYTFIMFLVLMKECNRPGFKKHGKYRDIRKYGLKRLVVKVSLGVLV